MALIWQPGIDHYAVFGNPIAHSLSPTIHTAFAKQLKQTLVYQAHCVELGEFAAQARAFFDQGGQGLNVTVPFKHDAHAFADVLSGRAQRAGAVNTLAMQSDGTILGDNTDGVGLLQDIRHNLGWIIADKRILVVGAGGAVRGVLEPLLTNRPNRLVIANRTLPKAQQLADEFADLGNIRAAAFEQLQGQSFALIINGTSASLTGELPPLPADIIDTAGGCYDMMYSANPTAFMRWASDHGAAMVADGLGMLVEQAAVSFALWRGIKPNTQPIITRIRDQLTHA